MEYKIFYASIHNYYVRMLIFIELFMFDIQNKIKCRGYITMNGRNGQKRYTVVVVQQVGREIHVCHTSYFVKVQQFGLHIFLRVYLSCSTGKVFSFFVLQQYKTHYIETREIHCILQAYFVGMPLLLSLLALPWKLCLQKPSPS